MTEPLSEFHPPPPEWEGAPERMTVLERYQISPILFVVLSLIAVFILYQLVGGVLTLILFGVKPAAEQITGFRAATGIGQVVFIFLPTLLLVRFATLNPAEYLRIKAPDMRLAGLPIVGIFSLQQILQLYLTLQDKIPLPHQVEKFIQPLKQIIEETYSLLVATKTVPELFFVIVVVAFIPAIAEEFLFRGLVQRSLERSIGTWRGVVWTGLIFGAYHFNPFSFVPLAILGVYLGFLTMRSGSIWMSVIAHFFNNAMAACAVYFHYNEDSLVTGDPNAMTFAEMAGSFFMFGLLFAVSTYAFIKFTAHE